MEKTLIVANTGLNYIVYINEWLNYSKNDITKTKFETNVAQVWDEILANSYYLDKGFNQYIAIQNANLKHITMKLLGTEKLDLINAFNDWWENSGEYGQIHEVESSVNNQDVLACKEKFIYVIFSDAPAGCKMAHKNIIKVIIEHI
ncbi:hypothetical protein C2D64_07960 [Listeria ivanovii]|uniref:hypothetical protein n=1 Tax=Listeria ivanovii TaxID=1638 RepID=UPI000DA6E76D|nr:hypothetical protein [Listeria ivanovii]MBC2254583.1 hypothetical protein [Listeria ivanovii]PZG33273.1 hypothetical protein C2D64_07960 [Listeria ivanovii]PZG47221.1 hypothetical protein C2D66_08760 [Listeria ivanovii]PZH10924.1 hypothetical protein C2D65_07910 [Listeria ivanovii]